jgi:uncharacterized protein (TIGR03437 family)
MRIENRLALLLTLFAAIGYSQVSSLAVINYSGFNPTAPVAAGSIASVYGNFGTVTTTATSTASPLPTTLAGLSVRVEGVTAPLYFVSSNQINIVIPWATQSGRRTVEVLNGTTVVSRGSVNVWDVFPALASSEATPASPGIIQNQNFTINTSSSRAARREIIQLYATGCGRTSPASTDGLAPTALSPVTGRTEAFVGNISATVQFSGAHPQFPGICQVNIVVPDRSFITGQVPVFITVDGIASNSVSVWVQ